MNTHLLAGKKWPQLTTLLTIFWGLLSLSSHGATLILDGTDVPTTNDSGTINGIYFNTAFTSGSIASFVELDISGTETPDNVEAGHNSSANPGNDESSFSAVTLGALPVVGMGGQPHFQILLDVNESGGTSVDGVRITKLQFYSSPDDGRTYDDGVLPTSPFDAASTALGSLAIRLDAPGSDNTVTLVDDGTGLNAADMEILVPVASFAGRSTTDYLYMYAEVRDVGGGREIFGVDGSATQFLPTGIIVPEPSGVLLALLGFGLIGRRRRS